MSDNVISQTLKRKITRRSFLKWTTAIGATSTLGGLVLNQSAKLAAAAYETAPVTGNSTVTLDWVPTNCLVCHGWCRIAVGVDSNSVVRKIEGCGGQIRTAAFGQAGWAAQTGTAEDGNPALQGNNAEDDTFSKYCQTAANSLAYSTLNRGRICAKGNNGMEHLYDPDRVKYPLLRVGKRGSGQWRKITWKQLYHGGDGLTVKAGPSPTAPTVPWYGIGKILRNLGAANPFSTTENAGDNYLDWTMSDGNNYYSLDNQVKAVAGTAPDRRHRFAIYVGRNESDQTGNDNFGKLFNRFADSYGTKNYVEHTNLCESSRHTAQIWQQKDKFPMADLFIKGEGVYINHAGETTKKGDGQTDYELSRKDNTDFFLSWGGNIVEASIPAASLAQRVADVRRIGGRIVSIDVRQSNTSAFADEAFTVVPGTDGAVASAVIHDIMAFFKDPNGTFAGAVDLQDRLAKRVGANGNLAYTGIFASEETTGSVPANKSLESYVKGLLPNDPNGAVAKTPAWAVTQCANGATTDLDADDIRYLAWAFSGNFGFGTANPGGPLGAWLAAQTPSLVGVQPPRNPLADGYRGPCKHSNGSYTYMLLRALQTLACGYDDGTTNATDGISEAAKRAGGVNRPGGLIHGAWGASLTDGDYGRIKPSFSVIDWNGGMPAPRRLTTDFQNGSNLGNWPTFTITGTHPESGTLASRIDNWDYHGQGGGKWLVSTHKVYSNFLPGVRASVGLHPYKEGVTLPANYNANPYVLLPVPRNRKQGTTNPETAAWDTNFTTEVLFNHKGNAAYNTPGIAADRDLFTATTAGGAYRLKWHISCDINFGDSTIYADCIIPDTTYLERYVFNWHENPAHKQILGMRQPVFQDAAGRNLSLWDARSIRQVFYEWARSIESNSLDTGANDGQALTYDEKAPWNGNLFKMWSWDWKGNWVNTLTDASATNLKFGSATSADTGKSLSSGQEAEVAWARGGFNGADGTATGIPRGPDTGGTDDYGQAANTGSSFAYMRINGFYEHPAGDTPTFWWDGNVAGKNIAIYNATIDGVTERNAIDGTASTTDGSGSANKAKEPDGSFFGTPLYVPIRKQGAFSSPVPDNGKYKLTTYRVNVHTHARTAACPRNQEMFSSNWAVMAAGSKMWDASTLSYVTIANGDRVKITAVASPLGTGEGSYDAGFTRSMVLEAKITPKAKAGIVSVSHSQGHDLGSFGGDGLGGTGPTVDEDGDGFQDGKARFLSNTLGPRHTSPVTAGAIDIYRLYSQPTAPSTKYNSTTRTTDRMSGAAYHGTHPNWVIQRGGEDPIGASVAYFDTMVTVEKA